MKVSIGSDHRGIQQRKIIADAIESAGHTVLDQGTCSTDSVDYPDIAFQVAEKIASGECDRGILICGTGIGMAIAANKVDGVRAAVCWNLETALLSRRHNDANVLCLSGEFDADLYQEIVPPWLDTQFEGGRHGRRVGKITDYEREHRAS